MVDISSLSLAVEPDRAAGAPLPAGIPVDLLSQTERTAVTPARQDRGRLLIVVAVLLAALASVVAVVCLLIASRTMAEANATLAVLDRRIAALAEVERDPAPAAPAPIGVTPAASADDVRRALDDLRIDLARHEGLAGGGGLAATMRDGQAELANRLGVLMEKVDRIDRALSSSRAAKPAAGRARPS